MRKVAVIFLILCLGWLCGADIPTGELCRPSADTQASVEAAGLDQWVCERQYNSDFAQPHSVVEVEPVRILSIRTAPVLARSGIKCGMASDSSGCSVVSFSEFTEQPLFAGAGVVDIYVYRLRRLII